MGAYFDNWEDFLWLKRWEGLHDAEPFSDYWQIEMMEARKEEITFVWGLGTHLLGQILFCIMIVATTV